MRRLALLAGVAERVNARTPRERAILLALALALVWLVLDGLLLGPVGEARERETKRAQALRARLLAAEETLARFTDRQDPNVALRERIMQLNHELTLRQQAASTLQNRLISPRDMPMVLERLLTGLPGLKVVSMQTLPPEPLGLVPGQQAAEASLYRHGLTLTLEGGYAELVGWLECVEKLPEDVFWTRAELDAREHPRLTLTLELSTLSAERTWLTL